MQYPILKSMLGDKVLQRLFKSWPDQCLYAHGPLNRLPAVLNADILTSIESLTDAYQGRLNEIDPRKGYEMDPVADGSASTVIEGGATAFLQELSPLLDGADKFKEGLELELGIRSGSTQLGAFISAAGSGAPTHYDVLDVISIQLVGTKKFYISPVKQIRYPYGIQYCEASPPFDDLYPQISEDYPNYEDQKFELVDMQPGSVLFMPRGTWHYTEAEQNSLAMSIILSPPTQLDYFLYQLKSTLLQDAAWRSPCYGLGATDGVNSKLYSKISNTIYNLAKSHQNPQSPIRSFQKDSRFLRNPNFDIQVTPGTDYCNLEYSGKNQNGEECRAQMEVSQEIAGIFDWIVTTHGPFTVRQCMKNFPGISPTVFSELFSRLTSSGLLQRLWFNPL